MYTNNYNDAYIHVIRYTVYGRDFSAHYLCILYVIIHKSSRLSDKSLSSTCMYVECH